MDSLKPSKRESRAQGPILFLALLAIVALGAALRFYNVNWDQGTYHIHPDERHTAMVVTAIQWPQSLGEYFDTSSSPLNPRNANTVFFYGTLPLFLTKFVATALDQINPGQFSWLNLSLFMTLALLVGAVLALMMRGLGLAHRRRGWVISLLTMIGGLALLIWGWQSLAHYVATHDSLTSYDQIHLVGRVLSGVFDLGSILLLFFLGRRLFDERVGLIASFLLAFTALNIQGSHYFVVDTFLTFFVLLTLWFTVSVAEGKGWTAYVALGLSMGLTLACKVSVFTLVVVVALGAGLWVRRRVQTGESPVRAQFRALAGLVLAALVALAVFRVAQPYAWAGPNYHGWDSVPAPWGENLRFLEKIPEPIRAVVMPNPQWVADIVSAGAQQTGEADLPWGRQWTERTPWLWPLENMVLWAMGVPLGVASWLGVLLVVAQLVYKRRMARKTPPTTTGIPWLDVRWDLALIPLAWVLLTFGWQGMQYVKSVRYFMPILPLLVLFAAHLVVSGWDWARGQGWSARLAAGALAVVVLGGALGWAFAFVQIYTEPVTRVQATRWMYENVETGATLHYLTPEGEAGQIQLPLPSTHLYATNGHFLITEVTPPQDLIATEIVMNHLTGVEAPTRAQFEAQVLGSSLEPEPLAAAAIEATFGGEGGERHVLDIPDVYLHGGQSYYVQTRVLEGAPLVSKGSAIANEHFDDPLPFNMDGRIAFGAGPYRGLDLALYDEDTPEKLEQLLDILDQADYVSMSSGRLWQSIPRLPMRYPVTTRYYELLFAEKLGFEKAAEFHSYPRLFGIEFDDTWAEEQFTVYDHPKVLIYRKTADYDRQRVTEMLSEGINWDEIPHWLNPRDVPEWKRRNQQQNSLMLTEEQRKLQEGSGTWASLFQKNSAANRWPTLSWLALLGLVGLAALPLTVAVLQGLPDRGAILARPVGVLLLGWLSWILTNLTPLSYTRGTIWLALGLIAAISWGSLLLASQRRRLTELWRRQKGLILIGEALFLLLFGLFWLIRWANPDLWHAWMGGEKPMDLAYLTAVIKSVEFPPYDPWFSGGYLNYYYFGQVLVGTLVKLVGIVPSVAYNLAIPTWFALTGLGAFSVTYNLVARPHRLEKDSATPSSGSLPDVRALAGGSLGVLFVMLLGNLGQIHLVLLKAGEGVLENFQSTIPGLASLVRTIIGAFEVIFGGKALPIAINEWYWNASRAIPSGPYESVITEFPFFTFLYGDLHAHLLAMPLAFLSLALAVALVRKSEGLDAAEDKAWRGWLRTLGPLVLWSLIIGALRTTNTWDVPPHLLVVLGALVISQFSQGERSRWQKIGAVAWQFGLVFLLSWSVLYWPFWQSYGAYYNSVGLWTGTRTLLFAYLVVHGLFLFGILSYLSARVLSEWREIPALRRLVLSIRYRKKARRLKEVGEMAGVRGLPLPLLAWLGLALLVLLELLFLIPGLIPLTRPLAEGVEAGAFAYRGLAVFALGAPVALAGLLFLLRPRLSPTLRLWAYWVLLGLAMTLGVEVIVVEGDIGRMNTVFKFYLQVWLMWGVAAAAAVIWMLPRLRHWRSGQRLWLGLLAALVFFAALYPPLAAWAKINDRFDVRTGTGLDGWAYMETAHYYDPNGGSYDLKWDLEAIRWLLDNVVGTPVILEGHAPEYRWGARYSINTGLPTVLGWNWHQRQQRAAADDQAVWTRANDVAQIYNTVNLDQATSLLRKYHVRYVIVGPLERLYYQAAGLAKFERMAAEGMLHPVFDNGEVTIYQVTR